MSLCKGCPQICCSTLSACPNRLPKPCPTPTAGLNSEQLALLDFLILARAEKYVGFGPSTFSFYLREHRMLNGLPPEQSHLVNASKIGTDFIFSWSALIANRHLSGQG